MSFQDTSYSLLRQSISIYIYPQRLLYGWSRLLLRSPVMAPPQPPQAKMKDLHSQRWRSTVMDLHSQRWRWGCHVIYEHDDGQLFALFQGHIMHSRELSQESNGCMLNDRTSIFLPFYIPSACREILRWTKCCLSQTLLPSVCLEHQSVSHTCKRQ